VRDYERKILLQETEELARSLDQTTTFSVHLGRVCELLRSTMRLLGGEDYSAIPPPADAPSSPYTLVFPRDRHITNSLEADTENGEEDMTVSDRERQLAAAEYALERECELARLEQENAMLRQLVAEHMQLEGEKKPAGSALVPELPKLSNVPMVAARTLKNRLGGRDIGPFGIRKKFDD
jgi:hypothetical protein